VPSLVENMWQSTFVRALLHKVPYYGNTVVG